MGDGGLEMVWSWSRNSGALGFGKRTILVCTFPGDALSCVDFQPGLLARQRAGAELCRVLVLRVMPWLTRKPFGGKPDDFTTVMSLRAVMTIVMYVDEQD